MTNKTSKTFHFSYAGLTLSQLVMALLAVALILYNFFLLPHQNMITWDNFGYYIYLPKFFIYNDPYMLNIEEWLYPIIEKYKNTPHIYQLNPINDGHIIRYPVGQSLFYAPFFFIAHGIAMVFSFTADGFSMVYQVVLRWGCFLYVIAGLWIMRKFLIQFFDEKVTSVVLIVLAFGTNLHIYAGSLSPHETLFFIYAAMLYISSKRQNYFSIKFWLLAAALTGLACITRPTDVIIGLIPLLWGITSWKTALNHLMAFFSKKIKITSVALLVFLGFVFIQMLYWKMYAGQWVYYTYETTEETLHLKSPYTLSFLFSFRKGWFIYSPLMFLALWGFILMYGKRKDVWPAVFAFYVLNIYLVSSWTSWWYADSFSSRAMVQTLSVSIFPLGFLIQFVFKRKLLIRSLFAIIIAFLLFLNLFQTWQFHKGIFPLDRLTKEAYSYIFLKTSIDHDKRESLMLINRHVDGSYIPNVERYKMRNLALFDYSSPKQQEHDLMFCDSLAYVGAYALLLTHENSYSNVVSGVYKDVTDQPHIWIKSSAQVYFEAPYEEDFFALVTHFQHRGHNYKYRVAPINADSLQPNQWNYIEFLYLSPELRSLKDSFYVYFWLKSHKPLWIDNFRVDIFERRD